MPPVLFNFITCSCPLGAVTKRKRRGTSREAEQEEHDQRNGQPIRRGLTRFSSWGQSRYSQLLFEASKEDPDSKRRRRRERETRAQIPGQA